MEHPRRGCVRARTDPLPPRPGAAMPLTDAARARVFVVDDQANMRSALQRLLLRAGFDVDAYASGSEFLARARLEAPGCILLDVSMPEMTGLEVQELLKKRRNVLPVIFLT